MRNDRLPETIANSQREIPPRKRCENERRKSKEEEEETSRFYGEIAFLRLLLKPPPSHPLPRFVPPKRNGFVFSRKRRGSLQIGGHWLYCLG
ncbi:hypothetical protein CEXT_85681 [Caerostris extrusa]|uniref:Uncharacterized protein n=1 Tax=Caerostris extrusa TaxID=172846 RepID=A0AAV4XHX4_CAEEX|nr:hypothetical protein CEXT_85681 [Caerostris extrusa]